MRCTKEHYDKIKSILIKHKLKVDVYLDDFQKCPYLTNIYGGTELSINSTSGISDIYSNVIRIEEWNENKFLECCGIIINEDALL